MLPYLIEVFIFIFGLCIGSFLNVCIYRLPASKSIVHPRSMCSNCGTLIASYDNIPILSYLWLKGRCRHCRIKISLRYPMVEVLGGLFALGTHLKFGLTIEALIYFLFFTALMVVTFIDLDHRIIPDVITLPGIPICFAAGFALPAITYKEALLGILIEFVSRCLDLQSDHEKRRHGWRRHQITGDDGCDCGLERRSFYNFRSIAGGNPGWIGRYAAIAQGYETGGAFRSVFIHRQHYVYFFRHAADRLVL